MIQIFKNF